MTEQPLAARDWRMIVGVGLPALAGGLFLPLTLVYFTVLTDIPLTRLGVITSSAVLITLPLPLVAGSLVDRWGASHVVRISLVVEALGFADFTVARSEVAVFAASALLAIGGRTYWSAIFAAIATHADGEQGRAVEWWFGAANVSRTVGITAGGVITGVVITIGSRGAYLGVAAVAAVLIAIAAGVLPHDSHHRPTRVEAAGDMITAIRDTPFVVYTLLNSIFALAVLFLGVALPTTMRSGLGGPGWLTATYVTANAVIVALVGLRAAKWAKGRRRARALAVSAGLWAAAYGAIAVAVALPLWTVVAPLALAVIGIAIAEAIHAPVSMAWASEAAPPDARGRYLALFQYSWLIAEVLAPLLFTVLFAHGAWLPFAVVAFANAGATTALPALSRRFARR